jgi:hypothetical protein
MKGYEEQRQQMIQNLKVQPVERSTDVAGALELTAGTQAMSPNLSEASTTSTLW